MMKQIVTVLVILFLIVLGGYTQETSLPDSGEATAVTSYTTSSETPVETSYALLPPSEQVVSKPHQVARRWSKDIKDGSGPPLPNNSWLALFTPSVLAPLLFGLLMVGLGLFAVPLNRLLGLAPRSKQFTVPRFQRSARWVERLGQAVLITMGLGVIVYTIGFSLLALQTAVWLAYSLVGLAVMGIVAIFVLTIANK
jgi:hypothetical protein